MVTDKLMQRYLQFSRLLLEEIRPFLTGQPQVRARRFGDVVTFGETFSQIARSRMPFAHGAIRTDTMVFHDLPTRQGLLHIVQNYGGQALQPTDFLLVLDRSIPRAAWAKDEGLLSTKWATTLTETGQKDPFEEFLDSLERGRGFKSDKPLYHAQWSYNAGNTKIRLPYTMQLIPLGDGRCVYLFKNPITPGFWSPRQTKFEVEEFLMLAAWLDEALGQLGYDGPPAPLEVPVPTMALLAVPEIGGNLPPQGVELPWPAAPAAVAAAVAPSFEGATTGKFCIACGARIPADAAFCPTCGGRQTQG